jgi:FkbM family methyltransferase
MKKYIKQILRNMGYTLIPYQSESAQGSDGRPVGNIQTFLEDVKVRGFNPALILDVGANRGDWTRFAKAVFPEASFLLIEPQEEMRESLTQLCSEFEDISWVEAGAGSKKDKLIQTIWDDLQGSSFLPNVDEKLLQIGKQREVEIVTIDSLIESHSLKSPDLVKLDIQGFELEALRGATSLFGHTEIFILEVSLFSFSDVPGMPILREVVDFMGEKGYETYDIPGFLRRPLDGALGQVDLAFAKREGFLRQSNDFR